ncbi:MAG: PIN domain-containing protein [Nocardioides marinisabuli]|uniref:PIN domain-containing protein n=1 Tax=Nocardioides marinisabuli TaxID=419476 RepID=UPI00321A6B6F
MLVPEVVPLPGVPLEEALKLLRYWRAELNCVHQGSAEESLQAYQRWAPRASENLGLTLELIDLESLIATSRHDTLLHLHAGDSHPLINGLISAEVADRKRAFDVLIDSLNVLERRCKALPRSTYDYSVLVPDTNVFLHQDQRFDAIDWKKIASHHSEVRVVVPMVVVRELDRHKRSASNNTVSRSNKETVRDRARWSGRELGKLLAHPDNVVTIVPDVSLELLLDPVNHVRNPDPDSELIERVAALKGVAGRRMAIVTSDNGMRFAAAVAGVDVISL